MHDCEHQIHHVNSEDHQNGTDNGVVVFDVDQDHCFVCEFDLGFFDVVDVKIPSFAAFFNYTFNESSVDYVNPDEFKAFSHRGPPIA